MAKVVEREPASSLYEKDLHAWAAQQAELLRERRFDQLDLEHLIEEVADLGVSERHAAVNRVRQILEHFLKLEYSPTVAPRRGWQETIDTQRMDLEEILSPSLQRQLEGELSRVYARARGGAARGLKRDNIQERQLPRTCPYALTQVLDTDWLPRNRHGLDDEPA